MWFNSRYTQTWNVITDTDLALQNNPSEANIHLSHDHCNCAPNGAIFILLRRRGSARRKTTLALSVVWFCVDSWQWTPPLYRQTLTRVTKSETTVPRHTNTHHFSHVTKLYMKWTLISHVIPVFLQMESDLACVCGSQDACDVLAVDVPAEEVMFHQHVLNSLLQRPLLLLLEKEWGKVSRSVMCLHNCTALIKQLSDGWIN